MSAVIRVIVGLGNPGTQYAETRHNAGFHFLRLAADAGHGKLAPESRFHGDLAEVQIGGAKVYLLAPMKFMNRSGLAVASLLRFYKIPAEQMLVVHDEIDLPPGVARLKRGGGHGGHNGLRDIFQCIGTREFVRLRIGVGRPANSQRGADYVLHRPAADEAPLIKDALLAAQAVLPQIVAGDLDAAMNTLHARTPQAAK